jgi:hypothetical protein
MKIGNEVLPGQSRAGNENLAHVHKAGRYNEPHPRSADGSIGGGAIHDLNSMPAPDIPRDRGICSSTPMTLDPHFGGRHGFDNAVNKPGEKSRSSYTNAVRNAVEPSFAKTRKTP